MVRINRRIVQLEEKILPLLPQPAEFMEIHFVDSEKKVVNTMVLQLGQVRPQGRGGLNARPRQLGADR